MNNGNWNQNNGNEPPKEPPQQGGGGLLRQYKQQPTPGQPPSFNQPPPTPNNQPIGPGQGNEQRPARTGGLLSSFNNPPPQSTPQPPQQRPPAQQPNWLANTFQNVRQWSGKMRSVMQTPQNTPPPPLVRYLPANIGDEKEEQPLNRPWKRSLSMRVVMKRRQRRSSTGNIFQKVAVSSVVSIIALIIVLSSSVSAYAYSVYQNQLPRISEIANYNQPQMTRIYDRNGVLLWQAYDRNWGRSTPITLNDVPQLLQDVLVATEDRTFWENSGVDPVGIARNLPSLLGGGTASGGGSTLTQQLVKVMTKDDTYGVDRKVREAALAIALTQQYTKPQLLEMYFNATSFGANDVGVETAAQEYFGLQPKCEDQVKMSNCQPAVSQLFLDKDGKSDPILALARASLLVGIVNNPTLYNPVASGDDKDARLQAALQRQKEVLGRVVLEGVQLDGKKITQEDADAAAAMTAKMEFHRYSMDMRAPWFVQSIINEMATMLGDGDINKGMPIFNSGGFNIRTSIDVRLQDYAQEVVTSEVNKNTYYNVHDAAVVVMDSKTGEVLAMQGGADFNNSDIKVGGQNNVVLAGRGPGSTFKPIVYAALLEEGAYPGLVLKDERTYFPVSSQAGANVTGKDCESNSSGIFILCNYDRTFIHKAITVHGSIANSFNVAAMKAMYMVGTPNAINIAQRLGIPLDKALEEANCSTDYCLSAVLGTMNITPMQMTNAYQAFANGGKRVQAQDILDIWDNYGHQLFHYNTDDIKSTQAVSAQTAGMITDILKDQPIRQEDFGHLTTLSMEPWDPNCGNYGTPDSCSMQVAAKTGTTDVFQDNWTIGYSPQFVVSVWAGNANGEPMENNPTGITGAGPIWQSVMACVQGLDTSIYTSIGIKCPNTDKSWGLNYSPGKFPAVEGLAPACVDTWDGLMAASAATQCTTPYSMLPGMTPQQAGVHVEDVK